MLITPGSQRVKAPESGHPREEERASITGGGLLQECVYLL